jgi:hypothetical protein
LTESTTGHVGIFWWIGDRLLAAGCSLADAEPADDWLDYQGGHAEHWDRWREAGATWLGRNNFPIEILSSEYDEHPRGRIVYDRRSSCYLLYADIRLQNKERLHEIMTVFNLMAETVSVRSDPHYR